MITATFSIETLAFVQSLCGLSGGSLNSFRGNCFHIDVFLFSLLGFLGLDRSHMTGIPLDDDGTQDAIGDLVPAVQLGGKLGTALEVDQGVVTSVCFAMG